MVGKSSKGVYVKTSSQWLVFLAFDQFRGPLTITLDEVNPVFQHSTPGKSVNINSQVLSFPDLGMVITFQGSEVWQPQPASTPLSHDPERHERLVCFTKEVLRKKKGAGLSKLLPPLIGLPGAKPILSKIGNFDWAVIRHLQGYIRNGEADPLARLISNVLGSGSGLTPSGDDFASGLLLTLNRWQNPHWSADCLRDLNDQVVQAAYAKTTSLSANLIECATLGLADERLINALDWLVTGVARESEIILHLMDWGHSSGVDAFAGMALTLLAFG